MTPDAIIAVYTTPCVECGDYIQCGDLIVPGPPATGGWAHVSCDGEEPGFDDRPRCRFCGDLLTPDFECESCPGA